MTDLLNSLLVSGCLGALIGLIRQWSEQQEGQEDAEFAGLRTFAFLALLGNLAAFGSSQYAPATLPVALAIIGLYFAVASTRSAIGHPVGYSTFAASVLAMFVGCLVQWRHTQAAVMVAVVTAVLLAFKQSIHAWTRRFTTEDIRSALQFAAVTGIILPLVPDQGYGPYQALNPHTIWLMVVLISGLGFVGYVLMRFLGTQAGITLTGLVGGLASSTATTLAFSRRSKEQPALSAGFALAVILACTVMLSRVGAIVLAVSPELFQALLLPLTIMSLPGIGYGLWYWLCKRSGSQTVDTPRLANPLNLGLAIKFALIYGAVNVLVKAATAFGQTSGLLVVSAISGLTDMDAIALSMADNVRSGAVTESLAARAVIVGAISNTFLKAGLALALGSPQLRGVTTVLLGLTALTGGTALLLIR